MCLCITAFKKGFVDHLQTPAITSFREPSNPTAHISWGSSQPKVDYIVEKLGLIGLLQDISNGLYMPNHRVSQFC